MRICRPGGLIHIDFDPLFASPWGLHAYRTIFVPYAQFLFSQTFIDRKLSELGVVDLGGRRDSLQPLNQWRVSQFEDLWKSAGVSIINKQFNVDQSHLKLVLRFKEAFRGREMRYEDLVLTGIRVTLRKLRNE